VFILSLPVQISLSLLTMALTISAVMMFWLQKFEDGITFFFSSGG
jgi:flagellar biosynthesis protein FliR